MGVAAATRALGQQAQQKPTATVLPGYRIVPTPHRDEAPDPASGGLTDDHRLWLLVCEQRSDDALRTSRSPFIDYVIVN